MGAPGLAFETWDPSRKCRRTQVFHAHSIWALECADSSIEWHQYLGQFPAFAWRIPGLKSETWGTHHLIQDALTQIREGWLG